MGPLELADLIGQAVNFVVARSIHDSYFGQTRFTPQRAQAALVDAGQQGHKTGHGVFNYGAGTAPPVLPAATAAQLLAGTWLKLLAPGMAALEVSGVQVRMTRGLTAKQVARAAGAPAVLFDWFCADARAPLSSACRTSA
jgi:3-hydroxybutyryl-CoA dehydrogenase